MVPVATSISNHPCMTYSHKGGLMHTTKNISAIAEVFFVCQEIPHFPQFNYHKRQYNSYSCYTVF